MTQGIWRDRLGRIYSHEIVHCSHLAIIRALVGAGANIHLANHFGGTCLINSVQSSELVDFLIRQVGRVLLENILTAKCQGADVNAEDVQHKTALHYAIQEHRLDTARILVEVRHFLLTIFPIMTILGRGRPGQAQQVRG